MAIVLDGSTGISSIGTLTGVTSISSAAADTPVILQDSSSNSNTCRAWVNFNGTSTVAIRADFNVTSITDNGTGDYTVNFTNAMPDANYAVATWSQAATAGNFAVIGSQTGYTYSTTAFRITARDTGPNLTDPPYVCAAIFR